jgi:ribosome-associated translation inhibitor RaiA
MQIQFNTDNQVPGEEGLANWARDELRERLHRFADHITRIEVHLSDATAARSTEQNKRCKLEARLAGRTPLAVSHDAGSVADALHGASDKLVRALDTALGRMRDAHGRDTLRGA